MNAQTIKAIASACAVLAVNIAAVFGYSVSEDMATQAFTIVAVIIATAYGLWKNHNFTAAAQQAQLLLGDLKRGGNGHEAGEAPDEVVYPDEEA